ncbi:MAG: Ig-like domain-containing protein, partial [Methanobrevibacter sp.]|uniref:Ig-like domain-containing protein n=1 Tax=Methanobrevibacter sp. TaxID=66852 RepID=UPI001B2647B7
MSSKKYSLVALSIFLIFILFIASASAADVNETDVLSIDESTNIVNENLALDSSLDNSASNDSNVLENNVNELFSVDNSGNNNVLKVSDNSLGDIPLCEGASIWYVDAAAGPGGNGTSKETAFQTLEDAVNNATDGDTIMVASGTYSDVHLNIGKYLNFEKYGDGEAIIDGSYITGILTVTATTINVNGLTFKNGNTADNGGAIYFENGIADSFINATFINNNAQSDGGAIYSFGEIVNSIINSTFIDNTAYDGGAIYFMGGAYNSTINSIFINNNATSGDGGAIVFKGGVNFTVEGEFINNTATKDGGAIYFDWDCLNVSVNATFINNTATNGGAIYGWYPLYNSTIGATFINNTANEDGGAIYFRNLINGTMSGKFVNNAGNSVIYILNSSNPDNEVHDSIFINNNVGNILNFNSGNVTVENNWFGNTAVNYSETPANVGIDLDNWLFLNATADSDVIAVNESSVITFILQSYKDSNVSDYDASKMNVWLDLTQTLGQLDKTAALIGDKITYTANEIGNSTVTGKFETASYDVSLKNIAPKIPTEIVLANETIDLKVGNISESMANLTPADAGNLTFNSSNESVVKVTVGGLIVAVGEGNATVTVSFAGNDVYAAAENKTISVSVTLNDASVIVENDTLNLNIGDKFDLNATAVPDLEDIQYNSSDESVAVVDENGTVTAVSEGTAIITLTVGDGVMYALNSTNVTVTVTKFDAKINASADDIFEGEVANVIVLLPGDATGNVTVFLNGDSKVININDTTVRGLNGALSMLITYDNLTVGNYVVIAMYSGDDKYNPSNDFAMFEVLNPPKKNATMNVSADTVTEGENATVNVVLPSDAIGNVTVGNITVPVVNGTANVTISGLAVGNTTLPVTYSGDDNYNPAETNVTVTVLNKPKIDSNIDVSAEDIYEGEVANVIVLLPGSATGNVTIVLNGKSKVININNSTVRGFNGALSMLVSYDNLTVGNYVVLAMYSGDDKYNPSTDIVMFKVSEVPKENATMNVSADPIIEGENATIVVALPEDASGNVTVGNDTVGVVNGTAIFTIPGLTLGNYTFPVVYSGDDKYNP